jgi:Rieske Fe-S protein
MSDSVPKKESCGAGCACGADTGLLTPIDRRKFVSLGVYAAAAAALAACAGISDGATAPSSLTGTIKVSDFAALSNVGGIATTSINGSPIAIVRVSATSFITLSRICPHQGSTVNATSTGFKCPNHGAMFDSAGIWVGGERTTNMRSYTTTYDSAAGTITIG